MRAFDPVPVSGDAWRLVEDQWSAATVRITDSLDEQARLEQLLDQTKPPLPPACDGYHYLIATPFRYRPYPKGSRFRRALQEDGVFYGSDRVQTALGEFCFYRLLFFLDAPQAKRPETPQQATAFKVRFRASRAIDLTTAPLSAEADLWSHPTDYGACQDLADDARAAGVDALRYRSVRCPDGGINSAILEIRAIVDRQPQVQQTWHVLVRETTVQAWCEFPRLRKEFSIADWATTDDRVPDPESR
ncbi:RES family NAD+ phosphorylase [uncultured Rhodospira sp.]|uniref:RES family NAD+ phosphorylase n=1 Tax=uncultured Rhodospira sp. TaxID=1936189 RepID=UPI00262415D5|nr:RES family NAD+ phosphorylase [uncultured Rhodospira sp.]